MEKNYEGIIATNDDATISKASCVEKGYYTDEYINYFIRDASARGKGSKDNRNMKRSPLINRGYYSRVYLWKRIIDYFITCFPDSNSQRKQIISLGAGFDTSFFNLQNEGKLNNCKFFEIDLPDVVQRKIGIILRSPPLCKVLNINVNIINNNSNSNNSNTVLNSSIDSININSVPQNISNTELHTNIYSIASADLNSISDLEQTLKRGEIDFNIPTLFLSECVLIYMKPKDGDSVIEWASTHFPISSFCTYEQISPSDPFGLMMIQNLEKRGCPLLSIQKYPSIESQSQRYKALGWDVIQCYNMFYIYNNFIDPKDRERVEKLEMFDELEEWRLIQEHYCIVWAFQCKKTSEENKNKNIELSVDLGFNSFTNK